MHIQEIEHSIGDALKDGPINDVMEWLILHFDGRSSDVLQAYGQVLAGRFGSVESVGSNENAYSCGSKIIHAFPQKLLRKATMET